MINRLLTTLGKKFKVDAHYVFHGGFWLLSSQASTIVASLLVTTVMAYFLSSQEFGSYRYIIGVASLLTVFSLTGMPQSVLQATSAGYKDFLRASTNITLLYALGITLISLIGSLYYYLHDNQLLALGCFIIAVFHPFSTLYQNTLSYLYGNTDFKTGTKLQGVKSLMVSGSVALCLLFTHDIFALLVTYFAAQGIASLLTYRYFRPAIFTPEKIPPAVWKKYLSFAKHSSYRNLLVGVASKIDSVIVFQFLGATELAIYTIASLLPDQIRGSFKNLQTLLLPRYTNQENTSLLRASVRTRSWQFFSALLLLSAIFYVTTPYIYSFLFPKYEESILYVQLLSLAFPASVFLIPLGALQARQCERELYFYHLSTSFIQIGSLMLLLFPYGLLGAVLSRVITLYMRTLISYVLFFRRV